MISCFYCKSPVEYDVIPGVYLCRQHPYRVKMYQHISKIGDEYQIDFLYFDNIKYHDKLITMWLDINQDLYPQRHCRFDINNKMSAVVIDFTINITPENVLSKLPTLLNFS